MIISDSLTKKKKDNFGLFSKTFWSREESFTKFYKITDRIIKIKKIERKKEWYLLYIKSGMPLQWFGTVHSVYLHCNSTVAVTVLWWGPHCPFFFSFEQYSSYSFFCLPFVLIFPFLYILFYYTINFIIFLQLLMCQFFISQNQIIKYEIMTNYNWKKIFCENVVTLVRWIYKTYRTFDLFKWH